MGQTPVIAFRVNLWAFDRFISPAFSHLWTTGINKSICQATYPPLDLQQINLSPHNTPDEKCSCGFYGLTDWEQIENDLNAELAWSGPFIPVLIEALGKVIVSERGIRAEYARIRAIIHTGKYSPFFPTKSFPVISRNEAFEMINNNAEI